MFYPRVFAALIATALILSANVLAVAGAPAAAPAPQRPNVLFILCDGLNTSALGCYGNAVCKRPNIDRLASVGVRFERAYSQWPLCWPSRNSFLTGRRPDARFNRNPIKQFVPDVLPFPQYFRNSGYFTARVGKVFHLRTVLGGTTSFEDPACWDLSEQGTTETDPCGYGVLFGEHELGLAAHPELQKFVARHELLNQRGEPGADYWMEMAALNLSDEQTPDGAIASRIAQLLRDRTKARDAASGGDGKPFFLAAGFRRPHLLWAAPQKYFDLYPWQNMQLPQVPPDDLDDVPRRALTSGTTRLADEQARKAIASYYACVTFLDAQVGKVLAELDRLKLWDNTIVVFTSDKGWLLGQHRQWGAISLFDESARVPLIIAANRGKGTSPRMVELLDLYPTLCDLVGLPPPPQAKLDGATLLPQLNDPRAGRGKLAYTVLRRGTVWGRAVFTERYRYAEWGDNGRYGKELYDHDADPGETKNLASDPKRASTMDELKARLDREVPLKDAAGDTGAAPGSD